MPVIWQISALHLTNNRTQIRGVILKNTPANFTNSKGFIINLLKVIQSYFIKACAHQFITVESNGVTYYTETDGSGSFQIITNQHHKGSILIKIANATRPLRIEQDYPIIFSNLKSEIDVISDIDDTIIVSNTANFFKRIITLAFQTPQKRQVIAYTQNLLESFRNRGANFYFVSKSESNLFGLICTFIKHNKLPKGTLYLTPHLKFLQLFNSKKPSNFKINHIKFIIENAPLKKYILLGDDTQRDMEIYAETVRSFPDSVLKIYIRKTSNREPSLSQKKMMTILLDSGVPVTYFKSADIFDMNDILKI
tara:strand:- start:35 stop:961 length:927 start_codon:yes stop_codon:yes gene_type:complete